MAEELELSEYATIHEHGGGKGSEAEIVNSEQSERRLLRIGILILGVLCVLQAILNVSLHLAFYSKEDINQFPCNISAMENVCWTELFQRNSTRLCSHCKDLMKDTVEQVGKEGTREECDVQSSSFGSGSSEEF